MRKVAIYFATIAMLFGFSFCNSVEQKKDVKSDIPVTVDKVQVYYFHGVRRCVTCVAVGETAEAVVKDHYAGDDRVAFVELNFDEPGNEDLVEQFQVTGSSLYIYNGHEPTNLTAIAFQYAKSDPEKLSKEMITVIDKNFN